MFTAITFDIPYPGLIFSMPEKLLIICVCIPAHLLSNTKICVVAFQICLDNQMFEFDCVAHRGLDRRVPSCIMEFLLLYQRHLIFCVRVFELGSQCQGQANIWVLCCSAICRGQSRSEGSGRWSWEADICVTFLMWPSS